MKKTKLVFLLLLSICLNANLNAQTKPAAATAKSAANKAKPAPAKPGKEETMNWIAEKMKENLLSPRKFISYNDGILTFSRELYDGRNTACTITIDLNKVTGMSPEYSNDFFISGKGFNNVNCTDGTNNTYEFLSISGQNYNNYGAPFNFTPDQSLVERLKKAFTALVEYNSVKKTESEAY